GRCGLHRHADANDRKELGAIGQLVSSALLHEILRTNAVLRDQLTREKRSARDLADKILLMLSEHRRIVGSDEQFALYQVAVREHVARIDDGARHEDGSARIGGIRGSRERAHGDKRHGVHNRIPNVAQADHQRMSFVMTLYISSAAEMTLEFIS